jgi:hypothetical protein
MPIDLRPVTVFPEDDLERWLESDSAMHLLPADFLDRDIGDAVAEIMENTRNGYPDDAIEYICCDLGSLSVESVEQWLEL